MKQALLTIATILGTWGALLACPGANSRAVAQEEGGYELLPGVTYVTRGDLELEADIYVPAAEGPLPAVLMVHGGAWTSGERGWMVAHARELASRGYVVMSIDYRLAPEYPFPAQIEDCEEAVRWLRRNAQEYKVDPERLAGYGYSAGGHLVCLLGMMDSAEENAADDEPVSTRLQAVVAGGAPCDFTVIPENIDWLAYWLGGTREEEPEAYEQASPVTFATADDPPVFFFQGEKDLLVWRQNPLTLMRQLQQLGVFSDMYIVPEAGHIGAFLDEGAIEAAGDFLDGVLRAEELAEAAREAAGGAGD